MAMVRLFKKLAGFAWDEGNKEKNWLKHKVTFKECEEAFADSKKKLFSDPAHSTAREKRYILFGKTVEKRLLTIAFTIRGSFVRVISARGMSHKERQVYEKAVKNSQI